MSSIDISTVASPGVPAATVDGTSAVEARAQVMDVWREAEARVRTRWDAFVAADRPSRRRTAFADYLAALDDEAVAADALARTHSDLAAAA